MMLPLFIVYADFDWSPSCVFQSACVCIASWDQWHHRSSGIFHKVLGAADIAVAEGVSVPAAGRRPHRDCHRPDGVGQTLLPSHLQLHQTGVQEAPGSLLTFQKPRHCHHWHSHLIFTDCAIDLFTVSVLIPQLLSHLPVMLFYSLELHNHLFYT